jgi:hypothetical protein
MLPPHLLPKHVCHAHLDDFAWHPIFGEAFSARIPCLSFPLSCVYYTVIPKLCVVVIFGRSLNPEERHELEGFTRTGKRSVKLVKRAAVILALDTSGGRKPDTEADIAYRIGVSRQIVQNVKKN